MNVTDNCSVCRVSMLRGRVLRLEACNHLFHSKCLERIIVVPESLCPICRSIITGHSAMQRKTYRKYSKKDRERLVACANRGEDWASLAETLNIKYKTAYSWISSGRGFSLKKGGNKPKLLSEERVDVIIHWLEQDPSMSLKSLKNKIYNEFQISISITAVGNYLNGRFFTVKQVHRQPITMNSFENKTRRADYVRNLNNYVQQGKQIVWIDETNFNLFCRKTRGRSRIGSRAIQLLPAARGPNVHLIGGISAAGVVLFERRRGSFDSQAANGWLRRLMINWETAGNRLQDLVIVCDNAPCHARLEEVTNNTPVILLRLAPYSPMLNPIETIWSKIKCFVKENLRIPEVVGRGLQEQRLIYLERIVDEAKNTIVGGDCARSTQHAISFNAAVLANEDMPVGM